MMHIYELEDKVIFKGNICEIIGVTTDFLTFQTLKLVYNDELYMHVSHINVQPYKGEQMTNKEQAKQQLEKLEAEMQKLKEIINKPEKAGSMLGESGEYNALSQAGKFIGNKLPPYCDTKGTNRFESEAIAQAYAEAFNTMLELRKCEGSEAAKEGIGQYTLVPSKCKTYLVIHNFHDQDVKLFQISPAFTSAKYAQAAIDKVGKEKIIKMFNTLHGIYD